MQRKLLENMNGVTVPMGMLHQYMPRQYYKVRDGKLGIKAEELVKDFVAVFIVDYNYAVV